MKIRTKLTIFFSIILFLLMILLSVWYQYRLFKILEQETFRDLDLFSRGAIERFSHKRPKNEEHENENEDERDDEYYRNIMEKYTWDTIYDENLNIVRSSILAGSYPIDNINKVVDKKYFKKKIKIDYGYFKVDELKRIKDLNLTDLGFYPKNDKYVFNCSGKVTEFELNGNKYYAVILITVNKNIKYLQQTWTNVIISLFSLIWIIIVIGMMYSKYMLNPINKIINGLNSITEEDLSKRIILDKENKDEIEAISSSINNLLDRLESAFNMQKQFISDVSHEFKTPISILQLNIDNICNNPYLTDDDIDKLTSSLEIIYTLDFLIKKLLYLSRLESNLSTLNKENINISELLQSIVNNLTSIAELKKLEFGVKAEYDNITLIGDKELLYIAFFNIIENALKYTETGHVLIFVKQLENKIRIIIEDTGIGIPAKDIDKIFNKFFRVDSSRHDTKSFGIGLTITKRILDIHNARIKIDSIQNQKTEFIIEFQSV